MSPMCSKDPPANKLCNIDHLRFFSCPHEFHLGSFPKFRRKFFTTEPLVVADCHCIDDEYAVMHHCRPYLSMMERSPDIGGPQARVRNEFSWNMNGMGFDMEEQIVIVGLITNCVYICELFIEVRSRLSYSSSALSSARRSYWNVRSEQADEWIPEKINGMTQKNQINLRHVA